MPVDVRRSQSAVVGAVIVALVLLAALGALFYEESVYRTEAQLSAERVQVLNMASELRDDTFAEYWAFNNSTYIYVNTTYPYPLEIYSIVLASPQGPVIYGPSSEVWANLNLTPLPLYLSGGSQILINVSGSDYSKVLLILQSGLAIVSLPASYSLLPPAWFIGVPTPPNLSSSIKYGLITVDFLNGTSRNLSVVAAIPIVISNPSYGPDPQGLQLNVSLNIGALASYLESKLGNDPLKAYGNGTATLPAANIAFGLVKGHNSKGNITWVTTNAWVEWFNSTSMYVWVRLPSPIKPKDEVTLYLLILNETDVGSQQLGVNSYYFGGKYDNIGYVMNEGVLYQVYLSPAMTISGTIPQQEFESAVNNCSSIAEEQPQGYAFGYWWRWWGESEWVGISFGGLLRTLYSAPFYTQSLAYKAPYLYCVAWNLTDIVYDTDANTAYSAIVPNGSAKFVIIPNTSGSQPIIFYTYGIPDIYEPVNVTTSNAELTNVLFDYDWNALLNLFDTQWDNPYIGPYDLDTTSSWLLKAIGWISMNATPTKETPVIGLISDDGGYLAIDNAPGHFSLTNWLGVTPRANASSSAIDLWAEYEAANPFQQYWYNWEAAQNVTDLNLFGITRQGDYRVFIAYFEDTGDEASLMAFQLWPSNVSITWYAPQFPPTGQYPYLWSPVKGLLAGPSVPGWPQGWVVG